MDKIELDDIREIRENETKQVMKNIIAPHQRSPEEYEFTTEDRLCLVAEYNNKILGTMSLKVSEIKMIHNYCSFFNKDITPYINNYDSVGFLCSAYVKPRYTGYGVGKQLLDKVENEVRNRNLQVVFTEAWIHGGDDSPDKLLENSGYERVKLPRELTDKYWIVDSGECSKCTGDCRCTARLYKKNIS